MDRKAVLKFCRDCSAIAVAEFPISPPIPWSPLTIWGVITPYDAVPTRIIRDDIEQTDLEAWALDSLTATVHENHCLVSLSKFGHLPWLRITFLDAAEGLRQIWRNLQNKELICCSCDGAVIRAITEEEYEYMAFDFTADDLTGRAAQ